MSAKAIREAKGKQLLGKCLSSVIAPVQLASYYASVSWDNLVSTNPWLLTQKLVVKLGLIKVNVDLNEAKKYINEHIDQEIMVNNFNY